MTTVYKFKAYYTDSGVGTVQDPAPTCSVINMADDSLLATAQATVASVNMPGLYSYEYSGADGLDCVAFFATTDTGCDVKQLASYVSEKITTNLNADVAGLEAKVDIIDTNVDAVLVDTGTTLDGKINTIDTVVDTIYADMASVDDVWDEVLSGHVTAGSAGKVLSDAALESTLTAIKGAGWSTETLAAIDVLIDAIKAKTDQLVFTTPNKVDATATVDTTGIATSAALAVVDANVDAIKAKTDALDVSSVTVVTAVNGTTITIWRGDTFSGSITDIGALTDYVSIDFTVKEAYSKTDDEATIRIRKNASGTSDGLMRLNGAAALSSALGSIAIDDLATGDITITLDETATDDLSTGTYVYDIQMISASGVKTLTYGS
jgi:hypothetical protein